MSITEPNVFEACNNYEYAAVTTYNIPTLQPTSGSNPQSSLHNHAERFKLWSRSKCRKFGVFDDPKYLYRCLSEFEFHARSPGA